MLDWRIQQRPRCPAVNVLLGFALAVMGTVAAATVATAAAEAAAAQEPLLRVITLTIEPGKQALFEDYAGKVRAAHVKQASAVGWQMASTVIGEDSTYTLILRFSDWLELAPDGASAFADRGVLTAALGEAATTQALAAFDAAVIGQSVAVYRYLPEYSREPPAGASAATMRVTVRIELRPSKVAAYLVALGLVREARIRAGSSAFWRVYSGSIGASNRLVLVYPMADWNDLNEPPGPVRAQLVAAFGEAQAEKTMATMEAAELKVESRLMRLRPELSYSPEGS